MAEKQITIAVIAALEADTTLMATATDVYLGVAPPTATYPFVVVNRLPRPDQRTFQGRVLDNEYTVRVVDQSGSAVRAENLALRIDTVLESQTLTITGYNQVGSIKRLVPLHYHEVVGDERYWHVGGTYRIVVVPSS